MEENKCGIYKLYWDSCKFYYIGKSGNIGDRYISHLRDLKKNKHPNGKLQHAFNKYGEPNVDVLEECEYEDLILIEMGHIKPLMNDEYLCNSHNGRAPKPRRLMRFEIAIPKQHYRNIKIKYGSVETFLEAYINAGMPDICSQPAKDSQ
jgi:hypothetical protein